jgi:hypothetical protein
MCRGHEILCRGHEFLSRGHEIIKWCTCRKGDETTNEDKSTAAHYQSFILNEPSSIKTLYE